MFRILLAASALVAALDAQGTLGPRITTATSYGVLARADSLTEFQAIDPGTTLASLSVEASIALRANARSQAGPAVSTNLGTGVTCVETGFAIGTSNSSNSSAGTSGSLNSSTVRGFGPHAFRVTFPAVAGTAGIVTVQFDGTASSGATASTAVDVDNDGAIDFRASANNPPAHQRFAVAAGRDGVVVHVATEAAARIHGIGRESYAATVSVFFRPIPPDPPCTFTSFGRACSGKLEGRSVHRPNGGAIVDFEVTSAIPDSAGVMHFGFRMEPIPLPFSTCSAIVWPIIIVPIELDIFGNGHLQVKVPPNAKVELDVQALTIHASSGGGIQIGATNGVHWSCR